MYYRRRASPKHRDNMTEVEYGGGGHRTRLRNDHVDQLCVLGCPPAPVYKGARGEAGRPLGRTPGGGGVLLVGVGLPSFLLLLGGGKEGGEGEGKGGAAPPLLVQFGPEGEGARGPPWPPLSLSTKAHMAQYSSRGVPVTPPALRFSPKPLGTILMSEYSRPIYQSLRLDHSETPRHVRDLIRVSKLTSVHQNA